MHYTRWKRHKDPLKVLPNRGAPPKNRKCSVPDCGRKHFSKDYCSMHYSRMANNGTLEKLSRRKRGSGETTQYGYRFLYKPSHPNASKQGYVAEHIFVMSESMGRPLFPLETVHHKNGVKADNRIENLELWSKQHPAGQRVEDKVTWAIEVLQRYAPDKLR